MKSITIIYGESSIQYTAASSFTTYHVYKYGDKTNFPPLDLGIIDKMQKGDWCIWDELGEAVSSKDFSFCQKDYTVFEQIVREYWKYTTMVGPTRGVAIILGNGITNIKVTESLSY